MGGFSGGHVGGAQHFGGAQHIGGAQHFGGTQHLGGVPHNGGVLHNGIQSGAIHHQNSIGTLQHNGVQQHLGNAATHHQLSAPFYQNHANHLGSTSLGNNSVQHRVNATNLGNAQHHGSQFLQNHNAQTLRNSSLSSQTGVQHHGSQFLQNHNAQALRNSSLSSQAGVQHHGSQFLNSHGTQTTNALHHQGSQNQGLQSHHLGGNNAIQGNSSFLAHHHQSGNTANTGNTILGNHHSTTGNTLGQHHQQNGLHQGTNHVGNYVHNNLIQNFNYHHNHNGGIGGVGGGGGVAGWHNHGWGGSGYRWGGGYGGYGGYGRGFGYSGFGFGLGRFGYGWGFGLGSYGLFGYPRWGSFAYQPYCSYGGYGSGGYGYGGYGGYGNSGYGGYGGYGNSGYGGYGGYGYGGYNNYGSYASLSPGLMGYGYGVNYAPYGSPTAIITSTPAAAVMSDALAPLAASTPTQFASADPQSAVAGALPTAEQYAQIGETAFKARDYKSAVRAWRHGLVDDPNNGMLVLMLSQALFATEQFNEAAGATQFGMQLMPQEKWETVVKNYRELYGKVDDYTNQLRALEKAAREKADDPALRFMLGYHYGFLGYPKEAVQQLEKCVSLAPEDESAQKLLELFSDKLPKDPAKKETPPAPAKPPGTGTTTDAAPPLNPVTVPPAPKTPEVPASDPKKSDGD